jgi:phospholipid transport system substrate-binding protein
MKKVITGIFLLCISFAAYSADNTLSAGLKEYITKLTQDASGILSDPKLSQDTKIAKARSLISNNLDFDWMARYTLGRIGRQTLSEKQIEKFVGVYSEYVTKAYTDLIKDYKGEQPKITGVRSGPNPTDFIVTMKIINNNGQEPITVEYLIHEIKKGTFKVANITPERVSLINAQEQEFTNTLQNAGFDQLIKNLEKHSK